MAAKKLSTTHILLIALAGLIGLFSLTVKRDFYNSYNLLTMITNVTFLGLAAVGFCINLING
jgi:ribose/xylose/arabinose/galactoside ABC-type transport system permease subunit